MIVQALVPDQHHQQGLGRLDARGGGCPSCFSPQAGGDDKQRGSRRGELQNALKNELHKATRIQEALAALGTTAPATGARRALYCGPPRWVVWGPDDQGRAVT